MKKFLALFLSLPLLSLSLHAQMPSRASILNITDHLNLAAISDPGSPANGDLWRSSTTADTLKYRSGGTTFELATQAFVAAGYQPLDGDLTSIAGNTTAGFLTRTASNTYTPRTITGTANEITVSNGSGASGNPTISLPSALTFTGKTVTGGTFTGGAFNGTVGATTPDSGAFTSVSASGNVWSGNNIIAVTGSTDGATLYPDGQIHLSRNGNPAFIVRRRSADGDIAMFLRDNVTVGSISVTTTATAYNTSSDARLKTNIRALTGSGAIIDALRPRLFDWRSGERDAYGFVAQELYPIFPQAVTKGDDDDETVTQQWAVDPAKLVPVLTAEIQSLRIRMATVESGHTFRVHLAGCALAAALGALGGFILSRFAP